MKRIAVLLLMTLMSVSSLFAQYSDKEVTKSVDKPRYQLYETQNMWTFIKLDTSNGKMWQVQYSVDSKTPRMECGLNEESLLDTARGEEPMNGRFQLYATQNMYNFLLLDVVSGQTYQVQWSIKEKDRGVIPIFKW